MTTLKEYLETLPEEQTNRMNELFDWIIEKYPNMESRIGWNQPMFTDHGTFIIGFSASKKHMSATIEPQGISYFSDKIKDAGYEQTKMLFKIKWDEPINYELLSEMIEYNIADKAECSTFWRNN